MYIHSMISLKKTVLFHDLLKVKLHAHELDLSSLESLHSYYTKRRQSVKINNTYNFESKMLSCSPARI